MSKWFKAIKNYAILFDFSINNILTKFNNKNVEWSKVKIYFPTLSQSTQFPSPNSQSMVWSLLCCAFFFNYTSKYEHLFLFPSPLFLHYTYFVQHFVLCCFSEQYILEIFPFQYIKCSLIFLDLYNILVYFSKLYQICIESFLWLCHIFFNIFFFQLLFLQAIVSILRNIFEYILWDILICTCMFERQIPKL